MGSPLKGFDGLCLYCESGCFTMFEFHQCWLGGAESLFSLINHHQVSINLKVRMSQTRKQGAKHASFILEPLKQRLGCNSLTFCLLEEGLKQEFKPTLYMLTFKIRVMLYRIDFFQKCTWRDRASRTAPLSWGSGCRAQGQHSSELTLPTGGLAVRPSWQRCGSQARGGSVPLGLL